MGKRLKMTFWGQKHDGQKHDGQKHDGQKDSDRELNYFSALHLSAQLNFVKPLCFTEASHTTWESAIRWCVLRSLHTPGNYRQFTSAI